MHIPVTSSVGLDDIAEAVDLRQAPADVLALSFTDSDLRALSLAWGADLPSLRLTHLRDLRHPMSVDLWIDRMAPRAKIIVARVLGGYEWWRYGCDRLSEAARQHNVALALLPGESHDIDERLFAASTLPREELAALLAYFRAGGPANMQALARRLAGHAGFARAIEAPKPTPRVGCYVPGAGVVDCGEILSRRPEASPLAPIIFYRSMLLADDLAPIDALCAALTARGVHPAPIFVASLKDAEAIGFIETFACVAPPSLLIATTAFASGEDLFSRLGVPVLQAVIATTRREAWAAAPRGLAPADMAMHVALPELDGRVLAGAISFKVETALDCALAFRAQINAPELDRIAQAADRARAWIDLRATPRASRRVLVLMPDYPAAPGRAGYAVGLDVPASVLAMLRDLRAAGYAVGDIPATPRALLAELEPSREFISLEEYEAFLEGIPADAREKVTAAWGGAKEDDAVTGGALWFRAKKFGNITVALAPDRGRFTNRRADYHDPDLPPRHALLAFGAWMRARFHALVHMGAHGAIEWLPGKSVALSQSCFPEIVAGALPVIYPFIVNNPGEAAQAKRRLAAVTLGHLPPALTNAGLTEDQQKLERLVDEFASADGLDKRRRDRLAGLIIDAAKTTRAVDLVDTDDPDTSLRRIDTFLCDLKEFSIKDGLHIYGRAAPGEADSARLASAGAERDAIIAALDGTFIAPGPAGAPARGRADVLPTGRNLYALDPRAIPTPTAVDLGEAAAAEALRRHCQDHGEWPRALIMDLWGSASLRTGGEEIAQGLALMGCRPRWDAATGRVTGIEVLPPAALGRPRVDVTWRISGLFRDMFPTQIALIDAAVAAIARREDAPGDNPLAKNTRGESTAPQRIFGAAPGVFGSGAEDMLADGAWRTRDEIGIAYLEAASHAYGGAEAGGVAAPGAYARRVADADLLIHVSDNPARDLLEGGADVAFVGGFAAAVAALGGHADIITLDTTNPARPRARALAETIEIIVRARAINPVFIAGQMRHGPRGASEFLETVDRLIGFAETTSAVPGGLIELVYDAYLGDPAVRDFMLRENPAAARVMAGRFASARRRELWRPLRNSIDNELAALIAEARALEAKP